MRAPSFALTQGMAPRRTNWKSKGKKKKKGSSDRVDLYALLGLQNERWTATELQIKNGAHVSVPHV